MTSESTGDVTDRAADPTADSATDTATDSAAASASDSAAGSAAGGAADGVPDSVPDRVTDRVTDTGADSVEETPEEATAAEAASPAGVPSRRSRFERLPSPVFIALLGITAAGGWLAWNRTDPGPFLVVLGAWLVTLLLHEWSHAALAARWGAGQLRGSGLTTLNPFRYPDRFLSVILPVAYLGLGSIGMTGPAHRWEEVTGRLRQTVIALVGPLTNVVLAVLFLAVPALVLRGQPTDSWFWSALVFLAFLQATAAVIAILPIPGMDGFAALAPYLPPRWAAFGLSDGMRTYAPIVVFALLWLPPVHTQILPLVTGALDALGLFDDAMLLPFGEVNFRFWSAS